MFCNVNCCLPDYSVLNSPVNGSPNLCFVGDGHILFCTNPKETLWMWTHQIACEEKNVRTKWILFHCVLQPMLCYRALESGNQSFVLKWHETPNDAGRLSNTQRSRSFWKSANSVQSTFFKRLLVFSHFLGHFSCLQFPWHWMPLLWGIQQLHGCILFLWIFKHNVKRET